MIIKRITKCPWKAEILYFMKIELKIKKNILGGRFRPPKTLYFTILGDFGGPEAAP